MGITVGELAIKLDADTKELREGLADAQKRLRRFEGNATKRTENVSKRFATLGRSIARIGPAIIAASAALGVFAAGRFTAGAIRLAASFEQIAISLEVLTGSAQGAVTVLAEVERLTVATPFSLEQVANTARSIAVVFGKNTEAVAEFTGIAADLAAAFGKPIEQIGENLTRAFSSGLGAADALREAGISAEILRISGAANIAAIGGQELAKALRAITAEGGKAFGAAAAQAESLAGAISNTSIAFDNFQRAFGDALSPATVDVLVNTVQPAFQRLEQAVKDNSETIASLAKTAFPALISAFGSLLRFVSGTIRAFDLLLNTFNVIQVGLASVQNLLFKFIQVIRTIPLNIKAAFSNTENLFLSLAAVLEGDLAKAGRILTNAVDLSELDEGLKALERETAEADKAFTSLVAGFEASGDVLRTSANFIDTLAESLDQVSTAESEVAAATDEATDATNTNTEANLSNIDALNRRTQAQTQLFNKLTRIVQAETGARLTALEAEIAAIDIQIAKVEALKVNNQDVQLQEEALVLLGEKRAKLALQLERTNRVLPVILANVRAEIAKLSEIDPEAGRQFSRELGEGLDRAGKDTVLAAEIAGDIAQRVLEATDDIAPSIGVGIADGVSFALGEALDGEAVNFGAVLGAVLLDTATSALDTAFERSIDTFSTLLTRAIDTAGDALGDLFSEGGLFSGIGSAFEGVFGEGAGELFGNAALGVVGAGLQAFSRDDDISATSANIRSAVDSAQRVRGIVAGPTSIGIAQVDRGIKDAFLPAEALLARIEFNTRQTAANASPEGGGSVAPGTGTEAGQILTTESESLT